VIFAIAISFSFSPNDGNIDCRRFFISRCVRDRSPRKILNESKQKIRLPLVLKSIAFPSLRLALARRDDVRYHLFLPGCLWYCPHAVK